MVPNRRETDGEREARATGTRERLLDAARDCLIERGHAACPVKLIAARAGVNHGLVHHYFGSKERLWLEVVQREAASVREALPTRREAFMDDFYRPAFLQHPDCMRLVVEFLGLAKAMPSVRDALREHLRVNREVLWRQLGLADEATATLVFGAAFGLAIQRGLDIDLPVEAAVERLMHLLGGGGPAAPPGTATEE